MMKLTIVCIVLIVICEEEEEQLLVVMTRNNTTCRLTKTMLMNNMVIKASIYNNWFNSLGNHLQSR